VLVSGIASWFATGPDGLYAAAGPALRAMLGPKWRGRYVTVSAGARRSIRVRINDWCGCPGGRLIDLADEAFARLAALSRGLIRVTVAA
jgi:rare lipoprotein A (peptidoglycan hydrolase)